MKRGPSPKPTTLKRLAGNPGKRPLGASEPRPPVPETTPYAPRHLNEDGKREWRRVVGILIDIGLYTEVDRAALAMYCQAWGRWVEAERRLEDTGGELLESERGGLYQNPWLHVANKAWEQMRKILGEFGLSPAARTRVKTVDSPEQLSLAELLFSSVGTEND